MSKYNYKGIIETQKKEKMIEEYMYFSSNELVEILVDRDLEIERLNDIINTMDKEIDNLCKNQKKEIERLNNIRKKAIEYINKNWGHWCSNHFKYATETINILKGEDKE